MNEQEAFFTLYERVHREGPGDRATLEWALSQIDIPKDGVICDAGCGSGADIEALLDYVPEGRVEGIDAHAPHVQSASERYSDDPRVDIFLGNFAELGGPYDLIWSAGAIYFLGITVALRQWRQSLKDSGAVAFSQIYWKTDKPSKDSKELWEEYPHMPYEAEVYDQVRQGGFRVIAAREISDAAWEEYYIPLEHRMESLRPTADAAMMNVINMTQNEINTWRANKDDFGYLMVVAVPE